MAAGLLALTSCRSVAPAGPPPPGPPIRLLLTFDDGPSIRADYNPTLEIARQLATNTLQPGIKAIFFVQTGHRKGGGTPRGREIIRSLYDGGHVIGLHSTSPQGHINHMTLPTDVLTRELSQAIGIVGDLTGTPPTLICPPFGARDVRTRSLYDALGLNVVLADVRARDGLIYGYKASLRRRSHLYRAFKTLRQTLPTDTPATVLVSFHDVNPYTARHMTEYLHILVEAARRAGFTLQDRPFHDNREELIRAAMTRRIPPPEPGP